MSDNRTLDEHFWFTATTLGFNAFVISSAQGTNRRGLLITASSVISLLAIFLIVDRFGSNAQKLKLPDRFKDVPFEKYSLKDVGAFTFCRFKRFFPNLLFAIVECSGSLFYIVLVIASWLAVLFRE
jgi:cytochrome c biogenesis protein CcdA